MCKLWHQLSRNAEWFSYALNTDEIPPPGSLSLPRVAIWFEVHKKHLEELTINTNEDILSSMISKRTYFLDRLDLVETVLSVLTSSTDSFLVSAL